MFGVPEILQNPEACCSSLRAEDPVREWSPFPSMEVPAPSTRVDHLRTVVPGTKEVQGHLPFHFMHL
jgi:hypothetical protein